MSAMSDMSGPKGEDEAKLEAKAEGKVREGCWFFGFRPSDFFRVSDFGFRISLGLRFLFPFVSPHRLPQFRSTHRVAARVPVRVRLEVTR